MEKYKRYYGIAIFLVSALVLIYASINIISPRLEKLNSLGIQIEKKQKLLDAKQKEKRIVENKIKKIKDSIMGSQKKVYAPQESDLGNDSLFFSLYNDVLDMIHSSKVRIKNIDYTYNPADDEFVKFGKDIYFVSDIKFSLVSNYVNLGKLIQDIYQYPYYIRIVNLDVKPYAKDKKVLLTNLELKLYAKTEPEQN